MWFSKNSQIYNDFNPFKINFYLVSFLFIVTTGLSTSHFEPMTIFQETEGGRTNFIQNCGGGIRAFRR